jgi:hypothetical protein
MPMPVRYNSYGADWFILSTKYAVVDEVAISVLPYDSAYEVHPINLSIFPCHRYFVLFADYISVAMMLQTSVFFPPTMVYENRHDYHSFIIVSFSSGLHLR